MDKVYPNMDYKFYGKRKFCVCEHGEPCDYHAATCKVCYPRCKGHPERNTHGLARQDYANLKLDKGICVNFNNHRSPQR